MTKTVALKILFLVVAQFAATSLWFAGNAVYPEVNEILQEPFDITPGLTIAVQLGFILGTLTFALFLIPDRFSPAKVFLFSAVFGALFNLVIVFSNSYWPIFGSRMLVGFFLAGIYPVGMKIAADWAKDRLGNALGFLVGALVLGTSFPHFLKFVSLGFQWQFVTYATSLLAIVAGLLVHLLVGDGPDRKKAKAFNLHVIRSLFSNAPFNRAATGYFGHMWELYTFWAFVPYILTRYAVHHELSLDISAWSFGVIAIGGVGCALGGAYARRIGSAKVAYVSLLVSMLCGLFSFLFLTLPTWGLLLYLLIWGFFVIPDSPQFSTLVAQYADKAYTGTALTLVNCLGFGITILSIEIMSHLEWMGSYRFMVLAIGPLLGLYPTFGLIKRQ